MTVEFSAEQEAVLQRIAENEGKSPAQVLVDTAVWLESLTAEAEAADRASIQRGLEQADRGEFVAEDEMDRRLAKMLQH